VLYALVSLVCAGLNDVVFKRYAVKDRSRGAYIFGIGIVWAVLQVALAGVRGVGLEFGETTLLWGLAAGALLTASNILLLESLAHIDVSLGSTIYRLNTVGVVVLSLVFLGEQMGWHRGLGVALGLTAVLLLYRRGGHGEATGRRFALFFTLAVAASSFRAAYGIVSKAGLADGAALPSVLVIGAVCWIVGGAVYAFLRENRLRITPKKAAYSLVSGVLVFLIVNSLLLAVEHGEASVVIPIANMSFVVALLLSIGLRMERLTWRTAVAVVVSVCSVILLSLVA
ncbi:MAG TPA: EamA family transporter, partial [Thermoleophilia bacterium]|nr:EamA family transporter [Thermoleophilia bacterium]